MVFQADLKGIPTGYPRLAAFISKDQDWHIFRKFKILNTRNILYLQSELSDLEAQLQKVDLDLAKNDKDALRSWWTFSANLSRLELIKKIRVALNAYSKFCPVETRRSHSHRTSQTLQFCSTANSFLCLLQLQAKFKTSKIG